MIRQSLAIFVDAYRELNARRLFWVVLGLSALVVAVFACLGISERGFTVLVWTLPIDEIGDLYRAEIITRSMFYKLLFVSFGFGLWLTWAATILALISTASIFPDFVSSGSIELALSRPIGRVRLFLTKYASGLLFVALQVSVFSVLSFVAIGLRGGGWIWSLFWAVPLVVLFFSYLFCVMTLLGVVTRSATASLIGTGLLWLCVFLVNLGEAGIVLRMKVESQLRHDVLTTRIGGLEQELARARDASPTPTPTLTPPGAPAAPEAPDSPAPPDAPAAQGAPVAAEPTAPAPGPSAAVAKLEADLARERAWLEAESKDLALMRRIHAWFYAVKAVLPKTSETMDLLGRMVITGPEMQRFLGGTGDDNGQRGPGRRRDATNGVRLSERQVNKAMEAERRGRSPLWIIGTSMLFQGVVLAAAVIIFRRRDF